MIIDVSNHNGKIDWKKVGKIVDYAILHCGYGSNDKRNDDKCFNYNATQCEKYGIPYGVYIYSYARNYRNAISEANHIIRMVRDRKVVYPLYIDIEDEDIVNKYDIKGFAETFVSLVKSHGYKTGVYSYNDTFTRHLYDVKCDSKWIARVNNSLIKPTINCDIWQYSHNGKVEGINGDVDLNMHLNKNLFSNSFYSGIADSVIKGDYGVGDIRKHQLFEQGINYWKVQNMVNIILNK